MKRVAIAMSISYGKHHRAVFTIREIPHNLENFRKNASDEGVDTATLTDQLGWLAEIGFDDVDVLWNSSAAFETG